MVNFALLLRVRDIVEVHDLAQANTAISLVILAFSLPSVLFGPLAGVMADRMNRRTLMAVINVSAGGGGRPLPRHPAGLAGRDDPRRALRR